MAPEVVRSLHEAHSLLSSSIDTAISDAVKGAVKQLSTTSVQGGQPLSIVERDDEGEIIQ